MTDAPNVDVIEVLTQDHRELLELIDTIVDLPDPEQRRDIADAVIAEIVRHSVAEEMYVYPAMREHLPDGDSQVKHDIAEHQQLEQTLKKLEGADAETPEFLAIVDEVGEQLRHHATDEEQEQFPQLRRAIPATRLIELAEDVRRAKAAAPTRPHPASPHAELFHKTIGSGVGLVDKLRDALSGRARNV